MKIDGIGVINEFNYRLEVELKAKACLGKFLKSYR
jgi:hypothetical protein